MITLSKRQLKEMYRKFQDQKEEAMWVMKAIDAELKRRGKK